MLRCWVRFKWVTGELTSTERAGYVSLNFHQMHETVFMKPVTIKLPGRALEHAEVNMTANLL